MSCKLSINVNKFALIRNSRGENNPDVLKIAQFCLEGGADGITVHPRPDGRHIRKEDVFALKKLIERYPKKEFNVEGYPSGDFLSLIETVKPHQVTFVPDPPDALTSSFGWDLEREKDLLVDLCQKMKELGVRSSLFIDPSPKKIENLSVIKPDRAELYTYDYAHHYELDRESTVLPYVKTAKEVSKLDIGLNAGHDLSQENIQYFLEKVPNVLEVSIGHAFVCDALWNGLDHTLQTYLKKMHS